MPNFTFCVERAKTRQQLHFSFPQLWYSLLEFNFTPEKIANIWRTELDGISLLKFEATQLYLLSDVFVAVAAPKATTTATSTIKKWIRATSNFVLLIPTRSIRQRLAHFSGVEI